MEVVWDRSFLMRTAAVLALGALVLAACSATSASSTSTPSSGPVSPSSPSESPVEGPSASPPAGTSTSGPIAITSLGGDAWGWNERVHGTVARPCDRVTFVVNGARVRAEVNIGGRRFSGRVPLGPGEDRVQAVCREGHRRVRSNSITFQERVAPTPVARIDIDAAAGGVSLDASLSRQSPVGHTPISRYSWRARSGNPGPIRADDGRSLRGWIPGSTLGLQVPTVDGQYFVTLRVTDARGRSDESTKTFAVRNGRAVILNASSENPAWVSDAVVYGVVPVLFGPHGLDSVSRRLPYLRRLGISAIWLSPIFRSPIGDYGYAVTDLFRLNPFVGAAREFRSLVQRAHHLGIRVLLDFPVNDTSNRHPYFQDAQANGRRSPYYWFYDRSSSGRPTHYFDWRNLPNLNYGDPQVRRMVVAAAEYWVRTFDIDGFRLDAAWGVRRRDPSFWPHFVRQLRRIKPDLMLLAEASARDPYYFDSGFNVAYDWTQNLGQWAWSSVFTNTTSIVPYLESALTNLGKGYPKGAEVFRFLNNNDTGSRFITQYGLRMTRVAAALLLTLPGVPELFTGDEVGASYMPYTQTTPISWKDKHGLRSYYRKLIALRERTASLHSPYWKPLTAEPATTVFAYARWGAAETAPALVLLNFGPATPAHVSLTGRGSAFMGRPLRDALSGAVLGPVSGTSLIVRMPAWTAMVLRPGRGSSQ